MALPVLYQLVRVLALNVVVFSCAVLSLWSSTLVGVATSFIYRKRGRCGFSPMVWLVFGSWYNHMSHTRAGSAAFFIADRNGGGAVVVYCACSCPCCFVFTLMRFLSGNVKYCIFAKTRRLSFGAWMFRIEARNICGTEDAT